MAAVSISSPVAFLFLPRKSHCTFRSSFLAPPPPPSNAAAARNLKAGVAMGVEAGVGVLATKLGMMSFFEPDGKVVPVTVVGFKEGNVVTQVKTLATDGYDAVQVGYRRVRDQKLTKPELGHLRKAGAAPLRHLQEFRRVRDVSGTTIGKGFQGGIKRHNFRRGPMTHGSKSHRALGSIGAGTTPGRVYKGKKMAGRMGGKRSKIRRLRVVKIDADLNVVLIKGAVPGKPGNLLPAPAAGFGAGFDVGRGGRERVGGTFLQKK